MPAKSKAELRFIAAHPEKFGGKHGVEEWFHSTPKDVPEKVKKPAK